MFETRKRILISERDKTEILKSRSDFQGIQNPVINDLWEFKVPISII